MTESEKSSGFSRRRGKGGGEGGRGGVGERKKRRMLGSTGKSLVLPLSPQFVTFGRAITTIY